MLHYSNNPFWCLWKNISEYYRLSSVHEDLIHKMNNESADSNCYIYLTRQTNPILCHDEIKGSVIIVVIIPKLFTSQFNLLAHINYNEGHRLVWLSEIIQRIIGDGILMPGKLWLIWLDLYYFRTHLGSTLTPILSYHQNRSKKLCLKKLFMSFRLLPTHNRSNQGLYYEDHFNRKFLISIPAWTALHRSIVLNLGVKGHLRWHQSPRCRH